MQTSSSAANRFQHVSPADFLSMIRRHIHWSLVTFVLLTGMSLAVIWSLPPMFRAETLILVDPQKVPERYVSATVSTDVGGRLSTISQEIMSTTRLQRIIDKFELYKDMKGRATQEEIIETMRADITPQVVRNFDAGMRTLGAFRISYQGRNPTVVAQVCNELASLFIEENLKVREQQAEGTSEFLDTQLEAAKKKLEEQESRLRDFKLKHLGEMPEQRDTNLGTLGRLQAQLQAEIDGLNRARQQEAYLQAMLASMPRTSPAPETDAPGLPAASAPVVSEPLRRLLGERSTLENQIGQLAGRYSENHPDVRRARERLKVLNQRIETEEAQSAIEAAVTPEAAPPSRPRVPQAAAGAGGPDGRVVLEGQLKQVQVEIQNRTAQQQRITNEIGRYQGRLENVPVREQQIVDLTRDYEISRTFYQSLLDKKMSADMAADLEKRQKSERFTILDPARVPEKPFKPKRELLAIIALAVNAVLGLSLGIGIELVRDPIRNEGEIQSRGLKVLARIPVMISPEEIRAKRVRMVRNWALGSVATAVLLVLGSGAAVFLARRVF